MIGLIILGSFNQYGYCNQINVLEDNEYLKNHLANLDHNDFQQFYENYSIITTKTRALATTNSFFEESALAINDFYPLSFASYSLAYPITAASVWVASLSKINPWIVIPTFIATSALGLWLRSNFLDNSLVNEADTILPITTGAKKNNSHKSSQLNYSQNTANKPKDSKQLFIIDQSDQKSTQLDHDSKLNQDYLTVLQKYQDLDQTIWLNTIKGYVDSDFYSKLVSDGQKIKPLLLQNIYDYFSSLSTKSNNHVVYNQGFKAQYVFLVHVFDLLDNQTISATTNILNFNHRISVYSILRRLKNFLSNYHLQFINDHLDPSIINLKNRYLSMSRSQWSAILEKNKYLSLDANDLISPQILIRDLEINYYFNPSYSDHTKFTGKEIILLFFTNVMGLGLEDDRQIINTIIQTKGEKQLIEAQSSIMRFVRAKYYNSSFDPVEQRSFSADLFDGELDRLTKIYLSLTKQQLNDKIIDYLDAKWAETINPAQLLEDIGNNILFNSKNAHYQPQQDQYKKLVQYVFLITFVELDDLTRDQAISIMGLKTDSSFYTIRKKITSFLRHYPKNVFTNNKLNSHRYYQALNYTQVVSRISELQQEFFGYEQDLVNSILTYSLRSNALDNVDRKKLIEDIFFYFESNIVVRKFNALVSKGTKMVYLFLTRYTQDTPINTKDISQDIGLLYSASIANSIKKLEHFLNNYSSYKSVVDDKFKYNYVKVIELSQLNKMISLLKTRYYKLKSSQLSKKLIDYGLSAQLVGKLDRYILYDHISEYFSYGSMGGSNMYSLHRASYARFVFLSSVLNLKDKQVTSYLNKNRFSKTSPLYLVLDDLNYFLKYVLPREILDKKDIKDQLKTIIVKDFVKADFSIVNEVSRRIFINPELFSQFIDKLHLLVNIYQQHNQLYKLDYIIEYIFAKFSFQDNDQQFDLSSNSEKAQAIADLYSILDSFSRSFSDWRELYQYQIDSFKRFDLFQSSYTNQHNNYFQLFDQQLTEFIKNNIDFDNKIPHLTKNLQQVQKIKAMFYGLMGVPRIHHRHLHRLLDLPINLTYKIEHQLFDKWKDTMLVSTVNSQKLPYLLNKLNNLTADQLTIFSSVFPSKFAKLSPDFKWQLAKDFSQLLSNADQKDHLYIFLAQILKLNYQLYLPIIIAHHELSDYGMTFDNTLFQQILKKFYRFISIKIENCDAQVDYCVEYNQQHHVIDQYELIESHQSYYLSTVKAAINQQWMLDLVNAYQRLSSEQWQDIATVFNYSKPDHYFKAKLNNYGNYLFNKDHYLWALYVVEVLGLDQVITTKNLAQKISDYLLLRKQALESKEDIDYQHWRKIHLDIITEEVGMFMSINPVDALKIIKKDLQITLSSSSAIDQKLWKLVEDSESSFTAKMTSGFYDRFINCAAQLFNNRKLLYVLYSRIIKVVEDKTGYGAKLFGWDQTRLNQVTPILSANLKKCLNTEPQLSDFSNQYLLTIDNFGQEYDRKTDILQYLYLLWSDANDQQLAEFLLHVKISYKVEGGNYTDTKFIPKWNRQSIENIDKKVVDDFITSLSILEQMIFLAFILSIEELSVVEVANALNLSIEDLVEHKQDIKYRFIEHIEDSF